MPKSWVMALKAFCYPVNLSTYERADDFPDFFEITVEGDRNSTILFENRYQSLAPANIPAFFEVVYWKYYSQVGRRQRGTSRIVDHIQGQRVSSEEIWGAVQHFIFADSRHNLREIRNLLGIKTAVLAVPWTLAALASPETLPMADKQIAKWVNNNRIPHNINRLNTLRPFAMNYTSLRENDFDSCLSWIAWCQEVAQVLTFHTKQEWRPRDVEMAVFTAQRNNMVLNVLP